MHFEPLVNKLKVALTIAHYVYIIVELLLVYNIITHGVVEFTLSLVYIYLHVQSNHIILLLYNFNIMDRP